MQRAFEESLRQAQRSNDAARSHLRKAKYGLFVALVGILLILASIIIRIAESH